MKVHQVKALVALVQGINGLVSVTQTGHCGAERII